MIKSHIPTSSDFDWRQLNQLAGEDPDFEAELLALFLADAEISLSRIERAIATQNMQSLADTAHSLRGASANVGASALAAVARQLEQTVSQGCLTGARSLLMQLQVHYQGIHRQLESRRARQI